jgi:TonB family protein
MRKSLRLLTLVALMLCAHAPRRAASAAQEPHAAVRAVEHFSKDGLSFDYPAGWTLSDKSNEAAQLLVISRQGSSAFVMVIAYRERIASIQQFESARNTITTPYVEKLARSLGIEKAPSWDGGDMRCIDLGERLPTATRFATGFRLSGESDGQPTTGEVYAVGLNHRFVNLVYVRSEKDEASAADAWKSVLGTLKMDAPDGSTAESQETSIMSGGVLNGRVVVKPPPNYPPVAKAAHQQGTVTVQVVVDEEGNVTYAKAVSGPSLLKDAGEKAAKKAKFTPSTVCGHPVKVSGVITYNFVLQFGIGRP